MAMTATRWVSSTAGTARIDTHIHVLPPSYIKALEENGGDPSGWKTPDWTLEECVRFSDTIGASFSVLSVTAPGPALLGPTEAGRKLARTINDEIWAVCCQRSGRFGFFASLPDFNDIAGTLEELRHIFEVDKKANGVIVMTSYGDRLLGDEAFRPIWEALDRYSALVLIHPGHVKITPEKISGFLPQPVVDYPQATTRAAISLLFSGIMTDCTNIDVILSHAGGTLPYLAQRVYGCLLDPTIAQTSKVNVAQAKLAISRFWYDLALSTSEPQLKALLAFTSPSRILYGSDFPYAPKLGIYASLLAYSRFVAGDGQEIAPNILNENATLLLKKHRGEKSFSPDMERNDELNEPEFGLEDSEDAKEAREQLDKSHV